MDEYELRRIRSGVGEGFVWVSLWFQGGARRLEELNLSCDPASELYSERDDQAIACYGVTERVLIDANRVEVRLNKRGIKALELPCEFALVVPPGGLRMGQSVPPAPGDGRIPSRPDDPLLLS